MKKFKLNILASALLLLSTISIAGGVSTQQVVIDDNFKSAAGNTSTVRNTSDRTQLLYCSLASYAGGKPRAYCYAVSVDGVSRTCTTEDPAMLDSVSVLADNGHLYFRWNDQGNCTSIVVTNGSPFGVRNN